ncbi:MAG: hypothetical protein ABH857_05160 [Elusimicrobiota bacterium]
MKKILSIIKKYNFELIASLVSSFIFYSPYLRILGRGNKKLYYFFIDELCLYGPQFIHSYNLFKRGIFSGVDFLTANGSSEFFLRPNIITAYPLHHLLFSIVKLSNLEAFFSIMIFLGAVHVVFAVFFSQLLAKRFFGFDRISALFFSVFLVYSSKTIIAKLFPPFFYIVALIPVLLYFALVSLSVKDRFKLFLLSGMYLPVFLSGYIPLSVSAIVYVIIFSVLYCVYMMNKGDWKSSKKAIISLFIPPAIASFVTAPFYLAILKYNKIASTVPVNLKSIAHEVSLKMADLITSLSYGIHIFNESEMPTLYLGLIPLSMILLYILSNSKNGRIEEAHKKLILISSPLAVMPFLISFGSSIGLSDIFYSIVPFLGNMHLYFRHLLITNVFFSIIVTIYFISAVEKEDQTIVRRIFIAAFGLFSLIGLFLYIGPAPRWHMFRWNNILIELLFLLIFLFVYSAYKKKVIIYTAILFIFILNTTYFYDFTDANFIYAKDYIFLHEDDEKGMAEFIKKNCAKDLPKYINCMPNERNVYVPRNYPWFVEKNIKLSNYLGYELHLASDLRFRAKFPYYEQIDYDWLWRTGADFVICGAEARNKHKEQINLAIDDTLSYGLHDGSRIYKLKPMTKQFPKGAYMFALEASSQNNTLLTIKIQGREYVVNSGNNSTVTQFDFITDTDTEYIDVEIFKNNDNPVSIKNLYIRGYDENKNIKYIPIELIDFDKSFSPVQVVPDGWIRDLNGNKTLLRISRYWDVDLYPENSYNNGIIKIPNLSDKMAVTDFYANYANKISFNTKSDNKLTVYYLLFPSRNLRLYIDNKERSYKLEKEQMVFVVPPGAHEVKIKYKNTLLSLFNIFYLVYFIIFSCIIVIMVIKFKQNNKKTITKLFKRGKWL